jgi:glutaredoxin-related protein
MMAEQALPPILITGAHRSGTTWVGKMLAADALTAYVSEPLNVHHRPGVLRARVSHWYQYICEENEEEFLPAFQGLLDFDYHLWDELRSLRSLKDFLRLGRDLQIFYNGLLYGQRLLIKDPFAVFSCSWFARRLECKVVITVRHPAALASSLKRLNWSFDFNDLLEQPLLMRDYLEPYRDEMDSVRQDDIIGQSALLWKVIYRSVHSICERHPDFVMIRHKDLARDPINGFRGLYASLGLEFSPRVEKFIRNATSSANPAELSRRKTHSVKLDSLASIDQWKKGLTEEEIRRVREITEGVSQLFYSDSEWP